MTLHTLLQNYTSDIFKKQIMGTVLLLIFVSLRIYYKGNISCLALVLKGFLDLQDLFFMEGLICNNFELILNHFFFFFLIFWGIHLQCLSFLS